MVRIYLVRINFVSDKFTIVSHPTGSYLNLATSVQIFSKESLRRVPKGLDGQTVDDGIRSSGKGWEGERDDLQVEKKVQALLESLLFNSRPGDQERKRKPEDQENEYNVSGPLGHLGLGSTFRPDTLPSQYFTATTSMPEVVEVSHQPRAVAAVRIWNVRTKERSDLGGRWGDVAVEWNLKSEDFLRWGHCVFCFWI